MKASEMSSILDDLHNGDLIRIEFLSDKDAKGAMEGRYMHVPTNKEGEQTYLHFTDGVRVFDLDLVYAQSISSVIVLEKWNSNETSV
jgi:hypothetical protein